MESLFIAAEIIYTKDKEGVTLNLPNMLSLFRIFLIPFTAYSFWSDQIKLAVSLFLLACFTDILDGFIARKFSLITKLGKVLDPLADKGMQLTVLFSMAGCDLMPWTAVIMVMAKEVLMFLGGVVLYKRDMVTGANWYGKFATVVISVCVVVILLFGHIVSASLLIILQWLPVCVAFFALVMYILNFIRKTGISRRV